MLNKSSREVPKKNYIFLGIVILMSALLIFYFYLWFLAYEESKLNTKIINRYLQVINYNELDNYLLENKDAYIYVSKLDNEEIREFEIKFKTTIIDNSLKGELLYLDITDELNDKDIYPKMINKYKINNINISNVPCILEFNNGILTDIYNIKENNYDQEKIIKYIEESEIK